MRMGANNIKASSSSAWLTRTSTTLEEILVDFVRRRLPHRRIAKLAGLLLLSTQAAQQCPKWAATVADALLNQQQHDGGWVDCEDTAWCSFVLRSLGYHGNLEAALRWLKEERSGDAWGYCRRDTPCIPLTSAFRLLVPSLWDGRAASWLQSAWLSDYQSPVRLSYKAAWYLLAAQSSEEEPLQRAAKDYLLNDQRMDGGWGPWRNHPAPTDCFCTGIAMWALALQKPEKRITASLHRALKWCENNHLPSGLFPTHFIEEGSAWIHLGCFHALKNPAVRSFIGDSLCAVL